MTTSEGKNQRHLSGNAGIWAVAVQIAVIYLLSTIPTPLYSLYQHHFHFSHIVLTLIFAVYVVGTVITMFFLGRLSDQVGRRKVVLISLAIAASSAVVFFFAKNTAWLFLARILSGLAIALASGASTAWIIELQPQHDKPLATAIVIAANLAGLALGALLAGLLAQFAPWPLRLSYIVFIGLLVPVSWLICRTQHTVSEAKPIQEASMRPRIGIPRELIGQFISPAVGAVAVFAVLGFYAALIPGLLTRVFHSHSSALAGGVVAVLYFVGTIAAASTSRVKAHTGLMWSLWLLLPSVGLLALAETLQSFTLLIVATVVGGVATGLGYLCSLRAVNELAPEERHSEVVSTYLIFCYIGISVPVIGVGLLSKLTGPQLADAIFAAVIAFLAAIALAVEFYLKRKSKKR